MELTIEQRAERAVKRKNKQISAAYPLFSEQFATTFDDQVKRIIRHDADNDVYFARLRTGEIEAWHRALEWKEKARLILTAEKFAEHEARYQRIYGSRGKYAEPEHVGYFACDWWHRIVKEHGL